MRRLYDAAGKCSFREIFTVDNGTHNVSINVWPGVTFHLKSALLAVVLKDCLVPSPHLELYCMDKVFSDSILSNSCFVPRTRGGMEARGIVRRLTDLCGG